MIKPPTFILNESNIDKMSALNLNDIKLKYKNDGNIEWLNILNKFPETLQREIIVERPNGNKEDILELKNWKLLNNSPIKVPLKSLLKNQLNLDTISRTPKEVVDQINKNWNLNVTYGIVYDPNPNRYLNYANSFNGNTDKPSIVLDGEIIFGVGRYIAALLRNDTHIKISRLNK